jgi:hypothetical protein
MAADGIPPPAGAFGRAARLADPRNSQHEPSKTMKWYKKALKNQPVPGKPPW